MLSRTTMLGAALAAVAVLPLASAAGGDLDPSFGDGGRVVTPLGARALARSVAVQRDGKVVVAAVGPASVLVRYLPDGRIDAGFGEGGRTVTVGGGTSAGSTLLALQSDGRIVVGGTVEGDFVLRRHLPDGRLDPAFGSSGSVTTDLGGSELLWSVLVQSDGRIVAVGNSFAQGASRFALARYLPDGRLDPSFGSGGTVVAVEAVARAGALASGGKVVAMGWRSTPVTPGSSQLARLVVARFTVRGALDRSFSGDGIAEASAARRGAPLPSAVAVQPDGRVVVANGELEPSVLGLVRFRADGTLDQTFGSGAARADARIYGYRAIAIDPRGRIVVAGHGPDLFENAVVARLTPGGRLDPRFGDGGVVTTAFGRRADANALAIQPDGRIVVAGWTGTWIGADDMDVVLARYRASTCAVPDVRRQTLAAARRTLERRGCHPGPAAAAFSALVPRGRVIAQRPAAGREVADHLPVTLVVSRGARP